MHISPSRRFNLHGLPLVLLLLAITGILIFGGTLFKLINTEIKGKIIDSSNAIIPGSGGKYNSNYTIKGNDGVKFLYTAKASDAYLPRNLSIGTVIYKKRGDIGYFINGMWKDGKNVCIQYVTILLIFFISAIFGVIGIRNTKLTKE